MWWIIFWIVGSMVFLYLLIALGYYFRQEKLIFFPDELPDSHEFSFPHEFEEVTIPVRKGVRINGVLFKVERPVGVVHFHHGNARNLEDWGWKYERFLNCGYDVFFYDYRTFGKSRGPLSEIGLHRDARATFRWLTKKYPRRRIVQYGASLGSGIATRLAKKVRSPLLILETPYLSMLAMADKVAPFLPNKWILKYPIRTDFWIKKLTCRILMFHGTEDEMIPYAQAVKLSKLNPRAELVTIDRGTHNDLDTFELYHSRLADFLNSFSESLEQK